MKKFLTLSIIVVAFAILLVVAVPKVHAIIDQECVRNAILNGEDPTKCDDGQVTAPSVTPQLKIFSTDCDENTENCVGRLIRSTITGAIAVLFLVAVGYGVYGMILRSTAGDNEEKLKEAVKIFKNVLIAIALVAVGFTVVQILSTMLGLGNVWEFSFDPSAISGTQNPNDGTGGTATRFSHCGATPAAGDICQADSNTAQACTTSGQCCNYRYSTGGRWTIVTCSFVHCPTNPVVGRTTCEANPFTKRACTTGESCCTYVFGSSWTQDSSTCRIK